MTKYPVTPTPATPAVMDAVAGAWVREHVLPARYIAHSCPLDICRCQYSVCGGCVRGRHDRCLTRQMGANPGPETHITDKRAVVINGRIGQVWRAGRPCRYLCRCSCPKTGLPPTDGPLQLQLFPAPPSKR